PAAQPSATRPQIPTVILVPIFLEPLPRNRRFLPAFRRTISRCTRKSSGFPSPARRELSAYQNAGLSSFLRSRLVLLRPPVVRQRASLASRWLLKELRRLSACV